MGNAGLDSSFRRSGFVVFHQSFHKFLHVIQYTCIKSPLDVTPRLNAA